MQDAHVGNAPAPFNFCANLPHFFFCHLGISFIDQMVGPFVACVIAHHPGKYCNRAIRVLEDGLVQRIRSYFIFGYFEQFTHHSLEV